MLKATYKKYTLEFRFPAITSRATMLNKETYFVKIWDTTNPSIYGLGECALFKGLGDDDKPDYDFKLDLICKNINNIDISDIEYSSIRFGIETALNDLNNGGKRIIYNTPWLKGDQSIPINGLIWMGNYDEMFSRINEKLKLGFNCLKLKIGGIDFYQELELLKHIRSTFSPNNLEIRLDANGAFTPQNALNKLDQLAEYKIHSIEQPIKQGQWAHMSLLCKNSPIPIALDEELIGLNNLNRKEEMLNYIKPSYIILKPSLCGGFLGSNEWITIAQKYNIGWWATSALESNIGLNAIAQWVSQYNTSMPQGLGTGQLYHNNIESPLEQIDAGLIYNPLKKWNIQSIIH